ncbi:hypothetical protein D3C76_439700 [compost metagenome]
MAEPDLVQQLHYLLGGCTPQTGKMGEGLPPRELWIKGYVFRQITELTAHVEILWLTAEYLHPPFTRAQQAEDQLHAGSLARTVMAEQPQHLTFLQAQVHVLQYGHATDALVYALNVDRVHEGFSCG